MSFKLGDKVICPNAYYRFNSVFKVVALWGDDVVLRKITYYQGIEDLERCDIVVKPEHNIKLIPYTEEAKILYERR